MAENKFGKYEKFLTEIKGVNSDPNADELIPRSKVGVLKRYYLAKNRKISNQFIIDHFATLWEYYSDQKHCDQCEPNHCPNPQGIHYDFEVGIYGELSPKTFICPKVQKELAAQKIEKLFLVCQLGRERYAKLRFDRNYINFNLHPSRKRLLNKLNQILIGQEPNGIYLNGNNGVGKTYIMMAFCNELIRHEKTIAYMYVPECIQSLKKHDKRNKEAVNEFDLIDIFKNADVLVVDSLGLETPHDARWFYNGYLLPILEWRIRLHQLTFFISNYTINELSEKLVSKNFFGTSIMDRISTNNFISRIRTLVGDNYIELLGKELHK